MQNFNADVIGFNRMVDARIAAGWDFDPDHGWGSPEGITESEWENDHGWPLPEDPAFAQFIAARGEA
jgi:hypothetical protein